MMNEETTDFWNEYWILKGETTPIDFDAFQFGSDADRLANLVAEGKKTATCSAHILYGLESESMPRAGQYSVVLSSRDLPIAIIQVTSVALIPMNKVPKEFALADGREIMHTGGMRISSFSHRNWQSMA